MAGFIVDIEAFLTQATLKNIIYITFIKLNPL